MLYSLFRVDLPIMTELVEEQTEHPIRQVFILSDGTAITFTYLDRFTVKMPWDADIAYKLGNVRTVVEQLEANQTGTINLMNDGRADFIPE